MLMRTDTNLRERSGKSQLFFAFRHHLCFGLDLHVRVHGVISLPLQYIFIYIYMYILDMNLLNLSCGLV